MRTPRSSASARRDAEARSGTVRASGDAARVDGDGVIAPRDGSEILRGKTRHRVRERGRLRRWTDARPKRDPRRSHATERRPPTRGGSDRLGAPPTAAPSGDAPRIDRGRAREGPPGLGPHRGTCGHARAHTRRVGSRSFLTSGGRGWDGRRAHAPPARPLAPATTSTSLAPATGVRDQLPTGVIVR